MNYYLLAAAGLSALTWCIHTFLGGPSVARPLLDAPMERVAKLTQYYCWHLVTLTLAAMAGAYAYAAVVPEGRDVALFVTLLAASYGLWSIGLGVASRVGLWQLPQWTLFAAIGTVALPGLW